MGERYLKVDDIADYLSMNKTSIYRYVEEGKIPYFKIVKQSDLRRVKMERRYLSIKEIQDYTGFSKETIYRYSRNGIIPCYKIGRLIRFKKEDIDGWFEKYKRRPVNADLLEKS